jgi:mono/diheme cytochrome c family protein
MNKSKVIAYSLFIIGLVSLSLTFLIFLKASKEPQAKAPYINWEDVHPTQENIDNGSLQFKIRCSKCHSLDGSGSSVAPSLIDKSFIHGGLKSDIFTIIHQGSPNKRMRGWGKKLLKKDLIDLTLYVDSLNKRGY